MQLTTGKREMCSYQHDKQEIGHVRTVAIHPRDIFVSTKNRENLWTSEK